MVLVARGDTDAFEIVYDRHSRVAYSLALRLLGDREAAEDIVQDAFLSLWKGADRYSGARGSVRSWVLSIVHHRGVDRLRTLSAVARRRDALEDVARHEPGSPDVAVEGVDRMIADDVRRHMVSLPHDQREVVRLAYFGGFSHREIAEMLHVPLGTVKGRMRLALERLRRDVGAAEAGA